MIRTALAVLCAAILAVAGPPVLAGTTTINFDDVTAPTGYNVSGAAHLGEAYSALGVHFAGPGSLNGGAILDFSTDGTGLRARSSNNLLYFADNPLNQSDGPTFPDGGHPYSPETITFDHAMSSVVIYGMQSSSVASLGLQMQAYDAGGSLVDSFSVTPTSGQYTQLHVASAGGIEKVVLNRTGESPMMLFDDLSFTTTPEPATLSLLALGGLIARARRRRR